MWSPASASPFFPRRLENAYRRANSSSLPHAIAMWRARERAGPPRTPLARSSPPDRDPRASRPSCPARPRAPSTPPRPLPGALRGSLVWRQLRIGLLSCHQGADVGRHAGEVTRCRLAPHEAACTGLRAKRPRNPEERSPRVLSGDAATAVRRHADPVVGKRASWRERGWT